MYPLDYPMGVIERHSSKFVLDPFCGRGTTNMAARLSNIFSVGIDSSRVAHAISSAKMVNCKPEAIIHECEDILSTPCVLEVPQGDFWKMMYSPEVLEDLCKLRGALLEDCKSPERIALRGLVLGALHGPLRKDGTSSYFSNQFPRTFASKPDYSVKYWSKHGLLIPPHIDAREIIRHRATRCYSEDYGEVKGYTLMGDSRSQLLFEMLKDDLGDIEFDTVITSPPYHGMSTYIPDQWIRNWFLGGPDDVEYTSKGQTSGNLSSFTRQLSNVWKNCSTVCKAGAKLCVRFGEIGSKDVTPEDIILKSLDGTDWNLEDIHEAGKPVHGRRSSELFLKTNLREYNEIDIVATLV